MYIYLPDYSINKESDNTSLFLNPINPVSSDSFAAAAEKNVEFIQSQLLISAPHPVVMRPYIRKEETVRKLSSILEADTISEREKRPIQSPPHNCSQEGTVLFLPQKVGGGQEAAEGYPHTAVRYRLRAVLREGGKITPNKSNSSTLLAGVRGST